MAKYNVVSKVETLTECFEENKSYIYNAINFDLMPDKHKQIRKAAEYFDERIAEFREQIKNEIKEKFVETS